MGNFLLALAVTVAIPVQLHFLYGGYGNTKSGSVAGIRTIVHDLRMSVSLGEHHFILFGYTSPHAEVAIDSIGVNERTTADGKGYFEFRNRFSPFSPREVCLVARDQLGRSSAPLCLPPFTTKYDIEIGPVIMPPTVSLNRPKEGSDYFVDDEIVLTGQTIPDSEVNLSVFTGKAVKYRKATVLGMLPELPALVKSVEAFTLPELPIRSDGAGNFSVSLPTTKSDSLRLFARTKFNNFDSPKSNSLTLNILPVWMLALVIWGAILDVLRSRLLELTIAIELGALLWYALRHLIPDLKRKNRKAIVLYHHPLPTVGQPHDLLLIEGNRPV